MWLPLRRRQAQALIFCGDGKSEKSKCESGCSEERGYLSAKNAGTHRCQSGLLQYIFPTNCSVPFFSFCTAVNDFSRIYVAQVGDKPVRVVRM